MIDPYLVLEISKFATKKEIVIAYRKLAFQWHPDKNGNSEKNTKKFVEIGRAYEILKDPEKRRSYDKYGIIEEDTLTQEDILKKFNTGFEEDLSTLRTRNFTKAWKDSKDRFEMKKLCSHCKGYGIVEIIAGFFIKKEKCKNCNGDGYVEPPTYDKGYEYPPQDPYYKLRPYGG